MSERYRSIVDLHLVLVRNGETLLSRRYNTGYADGLYHCVSGHLEDGESVIDGVIREAKEEIGITIEAMDLRCVHVMHQRSEGSGRVGFFFQADRWQGEPVNCEPDRCDDIGWFPLDQLPANMVPYPAAGLAAVRDERAFSTFGWA